MSNMLWGTPIVLACAAGYIYAWRINKKEQHAFALAILVLCGLALRIYTGMDANLHDWDERYHALVARHLQYHWLKPTLYETALLPYDYKDWSVNHIWLHKQPLTLWLMALSIKVFGLHVFVIRLPAILLSTIAIKLVYDIARAWCGRQVAFFSAFLFSIHGFIIELAAGRAGTDSVDAVFLTLIVLAVWLSVKAVSNKSIAGHLLVGAAIGFAILTKWLPALVALPVWVLIAYSAFKTERLKFLTSLFAIIIAAVAVALPWQLYILHAFPAEAHWEYSYNREHLFKAVEGHSGNFFFYFDHLRMKYGELIYLPIVWATWTGIKRRKAHDYAILAWFWLPYIFFSFAATKMEAYTVIAAPAVFIITAGSLVKLAEMAKSGVRYRYAMSLLRIGLIALPIRYSIERIKPFTVLERNPEWNRQIEALQKSSANSSTTVMVNNSHPIETMFLSDCIAYEAGIDSVQQTILEQKGYKVLHCAGD